MADASSDDAALAVAWHQLEITGIIQSVLCALFGMRFVFLSAQDTVGSSVFVSFNSQGVYFVLFIIALWASYGLRSTSSRRLRLVTIIL